MGLHSEADTTTTRENMGNSSSTEAQKESKSQELPEEKTSETENVAVTLLKEDSPFAKTSETENVVVTPLKEDSPVVETSDTENDVVTPLKEDSPAVEEISVPVFRQSEETVAACDEQLKAKDSCLAEGGECADLIQGYLQCIEAATTTE